MSDYGMMIFNEFGKTRLSITDQSFRLVDVRTVGQGATGSYPVAGITGKEPIVFSVVTNIPSNTFRFPHEVTISGDTINYGFATNSYITFGPSIIWVYVTS